MHCQMPVPVALFLTGLLVLFLGFLVVYAVAYIRYRRS